MKILHLILAFVFLLASATVQADFNSPIMPEVIVKLNKQNGKQVLPFHYVFGIHGGASTASGGPKIGPYALPAGSSVVRTYFFVKTPITSSSAWPNGVKVIFTCGNAYLTSSTATTDFGQTPPSNGWLDGVATGGSSVFAAAIGTGTSTCRPQANFSVQPATAGDVTGYIEYVNPSVIYQP